jgi:DNA mismatch repair protein MutH
VAAGAPASLALSDGAPPRTPSGAGEVAPAFAPRDAAELLARAHSLAGSAVESLAGRLSMAVGRDAVRSKGKVGALLERALGATGGSQATWDFPSLRIELKTIPIDARRIPRESTFVCVAPLGDADRAEWESSWVRAKLGRVLWIPIEFDESGGRTIGAPLLWSPTPAQERGLADDFEEIVGRIGAGDIEAMTARVGRWLQLRPKAAHGRVRTPARTRDGEIVATVPRGFYLRARFTAAILNDPSATPDF